MFVTFLVVVFFWTRKKSYGLPYHNRQTWHLRIFSVSIIEKGAVGEKI